MNIRCSVSFLLLCLALGNDAMEQSSIDVRKLLERVESLENQQRKTHTKVRHLERRVSYQTMVLEEQADQIKTLQKEVQKYGQLMEQTNREVKANMKKVSLLWKIIVARLRHTKDNSGDSTFDTDIVLIARNNSKASKNLEEAEIRQQKQNRIQKEKLSGGSSLQKRQERPGISFSAYLDHDVDFGAHQTVKFNKVLINDGNSYNIHSGVFTCPEAGVYLLSFFIGERSSSTSTKQFYGELRINSVNIVDAVVETFHQSQDLQGGNTVIIRLKQGDSVWVEARLLGSHLEGSPDVRISTFSGVYLYQ